MFGDTCQKTYLSYPFFFKNRFHFYNLIEKKFHTGTIRIEGENESR